MMILLSVFVLFAILAILILVHEFGHFICAKKAGMRVDEFGFGFPPKLFSIKKGETTYSFNLVPIGGFVKIHGEDGDDKENPRSFGSKSIPVRIAVILAGVTMNFIMAAVILSFGFWYGLPGAADGHQSDAVNIRDVRVSITQVMSKSPAQEAGIKMGDAISGFIHNGERTEISDVVSVQEFISTRKGEEFSILLQRGSTQIKKEIIPRVDAPEGEGALGIALEKTGIVSYPWYIAPIIGIKATFTLALFFLTSFFSIIAGLFTQGSMVADVAGPIGIGVLTHQVTQLGFSYILQFAAILSINLAIINVLPFPALDGGRAVFLFIEAIKGSPVSQKFEQMAHASGFALLILLMILITLRDIVNLF